MSALQTSRALFLIFLRLGLTAFGGPVAHLAYFREAFVVRRRWFTDAEYADLVALCQFLPGPASSQVGIGIGLARGGIPGACAAWLGFTLPAGAAMVALGYGLPWLGGEDGGGWLAGLKLAAAAVVAHALWGMARTLCPDRARATLAAAATVLLLFLPGVWSQVGAIAVAAAVGAVALKGAVPEENSSLSIPVGRITAAVALALFAVLLVGLPVAVSLLDGSGALGGFALRLFDALFRSGALVFGGGHVVLPLLQAEMVPTGWVGAQDFIAGYGAVQAMPGPIFTFGGYLGTVASDPGAAAPAGWWGGLIGLVAIFLPGFLLVVGCLPAWAALRRFAGARAALAGVNAAVVGLLGAALYDPILTSSVTGAQSAAIAVAGFVLLQSWKVPAWAVVLLAAGAGALLLG